MSREEEFNAFWTRYPRKVGRLDAQKAFVKALKSATADQILAGVERYKTNKAAYADWCHPATWLNQGRWMDEADTENANVTTDSRIPKWAR